LRGKSKQEMIINKTMLFVKAFRPKFNRHRNSTQKLFMIFVRIHTNISYKPHDEKMVSCNPYIVS
jgi:hypothetical protein